MSNQLELRSTFRFSGEGVRTLSLPSENRAFGSITNTENQSTEGSYAILKKNSYAVATSVSQAIYQNLGEEVLSTIESYSSKRLSSIINKAFSSSTEYLSLKNISSDLSGFDFNKDSACYQEIKSRFFAKKGSHSGHVIFHMPAFVPQNDLNVPKGATNFKIFARLISISDFEKSGDDYHALNHRLHGQVSNYQSTMQPVLRITTQPMTAQLRISTPNFSPVGMSSIFVEGVKYYSYKDRKFSTMADNTKLCVMGVY